MKEVVNVALLFGGRSAEHEVSILSARSIREAAPKERFKIIPICIARDGSFMPPAESEEVMAGTRKSGEWSGGFSFPKWLKDEEIDIAFPIVHGTFGEDGTLQGYLDMIGIPYVGSGVTASAVGMDKVMMKNAFAAAKLAQVEYVTIFEHEWKSDAERLSRIVDNALRLPYFVKPANAGSSVGVTKVKTERELAAAIEEALRFDDKVLVERGLDAREIEVSVLGNEEPEASLPGEIVTGREFYDYEDKYIDNKSSLVIPVRLPKEKIEEIRKLAIAGFKAVGASGFSRVDFFLERGTNRLYINEINTIPGFTKISMYPKLWEATELKYPRLIERLIDLGLQRAAARHARFDRAMKWFEQVQSLT